MEPVRIPFIPETAPFTLEQRAWLNGFLAGLFAQAPYGGQQSVATPVTSQGEPLLVMFGSQTGSAENLARKIAKESQARGFSPKVLALNEFGQANLGSARTLVLVSSTWGDGEPPDNATEFWAWLNSPETPRLENLSYAVLGLGDKNYSDFCGASRKFDVRLSELGARQLVPRGECDVDYESPAKSWCDNLWSQLHPNGNLPSSSATISASEILPNSAPGYSRSNPFAAPLIRTRLLNKPGSAKEVRHYEFSLADSGLTYEVGDALGVIPENCPVLVQEFLSSARCNGDEKVDFEGEKKSFGEFLLKTFDLTRPSPDLLKAVAKLHPESECACLLTPDKAGDLKKWLVGRDVIDVLNSIDSPISPQDLTVLLRKMTARLYSISSSPKAHPNEVHLSVGTVRYDSFGRKRKGVCSTYLADLCKTAFVFVQPSHGFKPPVNPATPMIMVGPGTGIAPFRAFLEERHSTGAPGKNWFIRQVCT